MATSQHFKGAIDKTATGEIFARPYDMFFEEVEVDGAMVPRFRKITE